MSNYRKARVETLKDLDTRYFEEGLAAMGYKADFTKKEIDTYWSKAPCDCVLCSGENPTPIGLSFANNSDGSIAMTVQADWDNVRDYTAETFIRRFTVEYHTAKYTDVCGRMGYVAESVEDLSNGKRRMVLRRAA